jgi:Family of unknown function (DUF6328)
MAPDDELEDVSGEETEEQRERYRELLEELRTVMPGTQVLFAFLLTAAFSQRFGELDDLGRRAFAAALLGTAVAAITLMTPAAFHRMSAPGHRASRLKASIRLQIAGMFLLLLSMSIAVFVTVRLIFDDTLVGVVFGAIALGVGVVLWYLIPLSARQHNSEQ